VMQLFDGDQLFVGSGTVTFPFDPWTVDRIEVLGGPSSVLYGTGAIGGVVNVVPRKPNTMFRENELRLAGGSFNSWRAAFDSAGPIGSRTAYRADVSYNRSDGWVERGESDSTAFSASLRHEFSPTFSLTISEDFGYQNPDTYFGLPSVNGRVDESLRKQNYNVADADIWYRDNWTQVKAEWTPSRTFRLRSGLQVLDTDRHWRNLENYTINPAAGTVSREFYLEIFHRQRQYGNRTDALINSRVFGRDNSLTLGFDYNFVRFQHENNGPFGGRTTVDLRNPEPGTFINLAGTTPRFRTRTHRTAFFAEDRLVVTPKLSLVGGFRADRYDVDRTDLVTNGTAERAYTPASWRGGVVYAIQPTLSVYGQYSTATDVIGNVISNTPARLLLDPNVGRQVEAGIKQTFWQQRGEWTFAGYYIVKENLLAPDPANPGTQIQIGQQSSRGVEATLGLSLPQGVRLDANLALLDARFDDFAQVVGGVLVSRAGNTPPNIPEQTANLWVTWDTPRDWQFRGGLRYVGDRFWNNANAGTVPGYTVIDAGLRRRLAANVAVDLRAYNLFDELYATTYYDSTEPQWLLGRPRSAEIALIVGF
jgi:iron complex outermembrane recepter protein